MDKKIDIIIQRCQQGEVTAQNELYRMYYKGMYNVSMRILRHTAEAEDSMQEAFLAAFRQIATYRGEVRFGSWLKRIVVNRSIDQLRKRKECNDDLSNLAEIETTEIEPNYNEISIEQIKKAIEDLPDKYRTVLSLFLLEGYDHDEIAEILDISNGSSRIIYHRAKQQLKLLLSKKRIFMTSEYRN